MYEPWKFEKCVKEFRAYKHHDQYYPNWSDLDMKEGEPIGEQNSASSGEEDSV